MGISERNAGEQVDKELAKAIAIVKRAEQKAGHSTTRQERFDHVLRVYCAALAADKGKWPQFVPE